MKKLKFKWILEHVGYDVISRHCFLNDKCAGSIHNYGPEHYQVSSSVIQLKEDSYFNSLKEAKKQVEDQIIYIFSIMLNKINTAYKG